MIAASLAILALVVGWRLTSLAAVAVPVPGHTNINTQPAGVNAGHLFLSFQHGRLGPVCDQIAQKLSFPVACPNLLPTDATIPGPGCCVLGNPDAAPLFVLDSHFTASAGYPGAEVVPNARGAHGHLVLMGMRPTPQSSALNCASTQSLGPGPKVLNSPSVWHFCPGTVGAGAGHLVLEWETEGIDYSISLHGNTADNRLAIELMTLNLSLFYPGDS